MPVPFVASVALGAVEAATDPQLLAGGTRTIVETLRLRFPDQHELLIGEHLEYANELIRIAKEVAVRVKTRSLARRLAIEELQSKYRLFPSASIELALAYGLARA